MNAFSHGRWHAWQGVAHVLLSDELRKELHYFKTADDCINWLSKNGYAVAARKLNAHVKGV